MKPFAIYGKKPRGSKTSKREVLSGIPVFLHFGGATGKSIIAYHDLKPYPRIVVSAGQTYWECRDKLDLFFEKNALDIQMKLDNLNINMGINKDILDKNIVKTKLYEIYTERPNKPNFRLVIIPLGNDKYTYLFANPSEAPTKIVKTKKIIDGEKVYTEFLRRKNL